jgi:2-polyprenyl-3-methyl-5-hydroxy-6-metoxy-1,4-benzoquinol methylase
MTNSIFENAYAANPHVFGISPSSTLADIVKNMNELPATAVDLGCGQGRNSQFLLSNGIAVTAIDEAPSGIAALERATTSNNMKSLLTPIVGDIRNSNLWSGQYDLIVATTIVDHLSLNEGRDLISQCIERLRISGVLYVSVHTQSDPGFTRDGPMSEFAVAVKHYFGPNELLRLVLEKLTVIKYEDRLEVDHTHPPIHQHGKAHLIARKDKQLVNQAPS